MSYSTDEKGQGVVFPLVIFDKDLKQLRELNPENAYKQAMRSGEYLLFDNEKEADWFTKSYKQYPEFKKFIETK